MGFNRGQWSSSLDCSPFKGPSRKGAILLGDLIRDIGLENYPIALVCAFCFGVSQFYPHN